MTTQTLSLRLPHFLAQRRGRYQARTAGLFTLHLRVFVVLINILLLVVIVVVVLVYDSMRDLL